MAVAAARRAVPRLLAMLIFACVGSAAAMGAGPLQPLTEKVELQELQTGFAGTTGTVWTVEPDGRYTIAGKVNEQLTPASGRHAGRRPAIEDRGNSGRGRRG